MIILKNSIAIQDGNYIHYWGTVVKLYPFLAGMDKNIEKMYMDSISANIYIQIKSMNASTLYFLMENVWDVKGHVGIGSPFMQGYAIEETIYSYNPKQERSNIINRMMDKRRAKEYISLSLGYKV